MSGARVFLLGLVGAAFIVVCVVLALRRHDAQQACIADHGVVHEYNCAMVSCGRGCFSQVCEWQCVQP